MSDKDAEAVVKLGCGCLTLTLWAAFWITAIVVGAHFIMKWW
jgi:hypothetical protein